MPERTATLDPERAALVAIEYTRIAGLLAELDERAWQMTRQEWSDRVFFQPPNTLIGWGHPLARPLTRTEAELLNEYRERVLDPVLYSRLPPAEVGKPPTTEQQVEVIGRYWGQARMREHERFVRLALSEGKSIPERVLADYPELAKEFDRG